MALVDIFGNSLIKARIKKPLADVKQRGSGIVSYGYISGKLWSKAPEVSYQLLWRELKKSPEVMACHRVIIEDVLSDGHYLDGGRNKILKGEKFWKQNRGTETIGAMLMDSLATGDGYIYYPRLTILEIKSYLEKIVDKLPFNIKSEVTERLLLEAKQLGDIFTPQSFTEVASETITIDFNEHGEVNKYVQKVGKNEVDFSPKEMIHFRLQKLPGKVYGYSPLESIILEMTTLSNIKKSANYYFEVGEPQRLYVLEDETPDSPNYLAFKDAVKKYSRLENRYKNLIATGKVTTVELNRLGKDMEFRELARYLTQLLIMVWGIPASRLSDLLVSSGLRGSTVSSEGYYRKISHIQDRLENEVCNPLLENFGVKYKFKRTYKQDEVREVQINLFKSDNVLKQQGILDDYDKRLKLETILKALDLEENDIEKGKVKDVKDRAKKTFQQDQIKNPVLLSDSPEKLAQNLDKEKIALQKKALELKDNKNKLIDNLLKKFSD